LGRLDEAIASYERAIALDPKDALLHGNLASALLKHGDLEEAIGAYREFLEIDPKNGGAWLLLGKALCQQGEKDAALDCARKAAELAPNVARFHFDLALLLEGLGDHDGAVDRFQRTVELDPGNATANYKLGWYQQERHRWVEAADCYRRTIEADPNHAEAHCNLAMCLQSRGQFAEALEYMRRGHELGAKRPDWNYPSAEWVRTAEMRAALETKLPAILAGKVEPRDNAERLESAAMAQAKSFHHAAVRLYSDAFSADPKSADDVSSWHRFDAATSAALAAAGRGEDAAKLDDHERVRLRGLALEWLRADLSLHARRLDSGKAEERAAAQEALRNWQKEADLVSIRDATAMASLTREEREAFGKLWAEVAELLRGK
jgi:tetratricopeptide (TPR) repeat protein